jgi:hypothetical protein
MAGGKMKLGDIRSKLKKMRQGLEDRKKDRPSYLFNTVEGPHKGVHNAYVFWLDLLGAQNAMQLSIGRAARAIMKIHAAALAAKHDSEIDLFPVIDGVYGVTEDGKVLQAVLCGIFESLALSFIFHGSQEGRFLIRAGVAFGPVVLGPHLARGSEAFHGHAKYTNGICIGMAMSQAYQAERLAPPFGVFIHESARAFAPGVQDPFEVSLWRWFEESDETDKRIIPALRLALVDYFEWAKCNHRGILYPPDRLLDHYEMAVEYYQIPPEMRPSR